MIETRSQNFTAIHCLQAKVSRWNFSLQKFASESLHVKPSCGLCVVVYMLKCAFCSHIPLETVFKRRVQMGLESLCQRYHPIALGSLRHQKK